MIIYEVSTEENDHYGYCTYYTDSKFYLFRDNADKEWLNRLDNDEKAVFFIRHIEDGENEK